MYQLYYSPGACSMAPHVLLNELNVPYELKKTELSKGDAQKPEFLKINSRGQVPVLVDGDQIIREGAAIIIHLLEKHNSALLPKSGKERTEALEWLCFANATMHPAYGRAFFLNKTATGEAKEQLMKATFQYINKLWADVEAQLGKTKYVAGNTITAADILLTVIANWVSYFPPGSIEFGANTRRLFKEVSSRPSYQKALQAEQVEYKAAA